MHTTQRPRALVTGASAGLGRAFADQLAARGHDLVLVSRHAARLDATARELRERHGVDAQTLAADLATEAGMIEVAAEIGRVPLDVLVHAAGFGTTGSLVRTAPEPQERMIRLHVLALHRLVHATLPSMTERGRGTIVVVSSVASFLASAGNVNYCATKAYQRFFAEALARELAGSGVYAQALCPGFTRTEFHARAGLERERVAPPWLWLDADRVVAESLAAADRRSPVVVIPGKRWRAITALLRHLPSRFVTRGARRYRRDGG